MKKILVAAITLSFSFSALAYADKGSGHSTGTSHPSKESTGTGAKAEHEHVDGYTKKDGTYVSGYDRSTKDETKDNNWSTKGNTNPQTGKAGNK
jgi:hypothetical protein